MALGADELKAARERLEQRLARVEQMLASVARREESTEFAHVDNHPSDLATDLHDRELDETTVLLLRDERDRIRAALRAIEHGTYGICIDCHREIPRERLQAAPDALRCLSCQRKREAYLRQHIHPDGGRG